MKRIIILSALFCLAAQLGLAQTDSLVYIWSAERKIVEKDGIKYRYIEVQTNKVSDEIVGDLGFAESWARACQDSILLSRDKVTVVADRFFKRYLQALKDAANTGVYDYPVKDYKNFDVTAIQYDILNKGFEFGVGGGAILPMGEMSKLVTPMLGISGEAGILLKKGVVTADLMVGFGAEKDRYVYVHGRDRQSLVPYVSIAANYKYPVKEFGKDRLLLTAGAGHGHSVVNVSMHLGNKDLTRTNVSAGGMMYTLGVAYDHKISESINFLRGKHKKQDSYIRYRLYTDQIIDLKEKVATPMVLFSVSFVNVDQRIKIR